MVDFKLSDEQVEIQRVAKSFCEKEIKPIASIYDKKTDPKECIPWDVIKKGAILGFPFMGAPKEYGGYGGGDLDVCIVAEELAVGDIGLAGGLLISNDIINLISKHGTEEQKKKWLPQICSPDSPYLLALAVTEPESGSDFASTDPKTGIKTTAKKAGDKYIMNGTKCFITNGGIAKLYLVFARTDPEKGAMEGISAFLVPDDAPGFSIGKIEDKMGQRLLQNSELIFEDTPVPSKNLLGGEGNGFFVVLDFLTGGGPGVGALCVGLARAAFEAANEYAQVRVQGGNPIKFHQAIGMKLFDMKMNIEAARNLVWKAAWHNDHVAHDNLLSAFAKVFCSDMVNRVVTEAVQVLGGYGYSKEFPVEKYMRDAKVTQIYDGTNEILRINSILFI